MRATSDRTKSVGNYRLGRLLGRGATGRVFLGRSPEGARVAVKVFDEALFAEPRMERRWLDEARAGTSIEHENVVHVLDAGVAREAGRALHYLVMEYVEGETLRRFAHATGAIPEDACLEIGLQIARALDAIHGRSVVHGDLKPENVLVAQDGMVKVADLGVAAIWDGLTKRSTQDGFAGTFLYAAPERLRGGRDADGRGDLYALGLILHELGAGRHPFEGMSLAELLHAQTAVDPEPLTADGRRFSPFFSDLVRTLLAKEPERRFETTAQALQTFERGGDSPWWRRRRRGARRGAEEAPPAQDGTDRVFVGRRAELTELRRRLDAARAGRGSAVLVTGEAGVGKSRLVAQFLAAAPGPRALVLRGSYPLGGAAPAAWAYVDALRGRLADAAETDGVRRSIRASSRSRASFAAMLEGRDPPEGGPPLTSGSMETAIADVVASLARGRLVVLVVEDLHFAGPAAARTFASLAARWARSRVFLLGTSRAPEVPDGAAHVALSGLSETQIRQALAASIHHPETTEAVFGPVWRGSRGNPFVAMEIVRDLRERGALRRSPDGGWRLTASPSASEAPSALRRIAASRLARVSARDRRLVEAAAVLGAAFDPALLAAALGEPPETVRRRLVRLALRTGLVLRRGDGFRFDHDSTVESVRASMPARDAARHHGRIADALAASAADDDGGRTSALCEHLVAAGRADEVPPHVHRAVAHLESTVQFERCLRLMDGVIAARDLVPEATRLRLLLRHDYSRRHVGWPIDDVASVNEAVELAERGGDPVLECRALLRLIVRLEFLGRRESLAPRAARALALARQVSDPDLSVRALMSCSISAAGLRDRDAAFALAREAVRRAEESGRPHLVASSLFTLGEQHERWSDPKGLSDVSERQLALFSGWTDPEIGLRARYEGVNAAGGMEEWDVVVRRGRAVLAEARRAGQVPFECALCGLLAEAHFALGEFARARGFAARQAALAAPMAHVHSIVSADAQLGDLAVAEGRWAEGLRTLESAESRRAELGDPRFTNHSTRRRGALLAALGRFEAAAELLDRPPPPGGLVDVPRADWHAGELRLARGDADGALAAWERAIRGFRDAGVERAARRTEVARDLVLASLGRAAETRGRFSKSLSHARETGEHELVARCVTGLALAGAADAREAAATLLRLRRRLTVAARMRCAWLLWSACGDARLLRAAKADLRLLVANAPFEDRVRMLRVVPLYRAIAEAGKPRRVSGGRDADAPRRDRPSARAGARSAPRRGAVRGRAPASRA